MTDDRELVIRALRQLAEAAREGQAADAHPTVEEIIAYHAGELAEAGEKELALQQHLRICRECPDLILALDGFAELTEGDALPPPAEADSAWEEVRQQLAREGWFKDEKPEASRYWRTLLVPRWRLYTAVAAVAVACLAFFMIGGPAWRQPQIVAEPEAGVPVRDVPPMVRSRVPEIAVPRSAEHFFLSASPEGPSHPEYQVELRGAGTPGPLLWSGRWHPQSSTDLFLRVPRGFLSSGEYRLALVGLSGGHPVPEPPDERRFDLVFR